MKKFIFCLLALWATELLSQNKQVLYGLEEVPQSLLLNPGGNVSQKYHFGIPFLSQIHINGGASGVSAFDIFGNSNTDINTRIRNKIFEMDDKDFFTVNQQLTIIDFGWRNKKDIYFSGGMYQELDFITYFPRDLAILAWEGNQQYLDYDFDLGELSLTGEMLTVFHFGANKKVNDNLTLGVRAKIYSSLIHFQSINNTGTFTTTESTNGINIYEHILRDIDVSVQTSGYASLRDADGSSEVVSDILGRTFFGGNLGLGFDFGATYDIGRNWTVSGSVLDLGAVFHTKDVENYESKGDYTINGIELIFPPLAEGEPTIPYFSNLEDDFEREVGVDTVNTSYTQWRPLKVNGAVEYRFGRGMGDACDCYNMGGAIKTGQSIGLQMFSVFRPKGPQVAGTLFYYRRLWDFLAAKATYTVDPYSYSNVGLGMVADVGKFNFYLAADNLLRYGNIAKAKSVSLQLGFNIKIDEP
ncbi:hypothetical protein INR76_07125 [Marixanthomonas sp. SCSIO 43207]|uniref:DUF5723 family protein n=1 Tax=Marixanthomonas sp. SCSIO 43207 TaxID=2779360 RepID=UPI001CA8929A|nr:DUF5723 family protein [Marixanthomonas sp. SCSIO 43207]UAB79911.1 hypothetical protein INR76_07125 [Marixanthomonas sp. SCSIO 43207]